MKILFLLFPLILLSVQVAAGGAVTCWQQRGFCTIHACPQATRIIGKCSRGLFCCK
ncbi:AMP1 protein, partial [Malurus elegans]|nr:AMP1 protein [Malurus elegans]